MSLFTQFLRPRFNGNGTHGGHGGHGSPSARGYAAPQPATQPALPPFLTQLNWLCKSARHVLPVRMQFVGIGYSDKGYPYAEYRCPVCGAMHAIVQHFQTGKPIPLFTRDS